MSERYYSILFCGLFVTFEDLFVANVLVYFNPFQANVPFLYPLKMSENLWSSDGFRGYRKGTLAWNGLNRSSAKHIQPISKLYQVFLLEKNKNSEWR